MEKRAKVQGSVDVGVAFGGTAGSLISGGIVAYSSYAFLGFFGMYIAVLFIPLILWSHYKTKRESLKKAG